MKKFTRLVMEMLKLHKRCDKVENEHSRRAKIDKVWFIAARYWSNETLHELNNAF